jgi:hypothetical protein
MAVPYDDPFDDLAVSRLRRHSLQHASRKQEAGNRIRMALRCLWPFVQRFFQGDTRTESKTRYNKHID